MRRAIALLFTVAIIAVLFQPACATMIVVHDGNGYRSPNANVQVFANGQQICYGQTDNSGTLYCSMTYNTYYQVYASGYGQNGNWQGDRPGDEIDIYMH